MALNPSLLTALRGRAINLLTSRTIVSKAFLDRSDKPAPFPYVDKHYNSLVGLYDRTTPRLDQNSKLICVEGAHAIGKTELAKELAETFDMKYVGPPNMDEILINHYGEDMRDYEHLFPDFFKSLDDKDFFKNPLGKPLGAMDRFLYRTFFLKFLHQLDAIRHILNTGQGVVLEKCAQADYCYFNAAYNAGWVQPEMREMYYMIMDNSLHEVFRPNLIVYLDAPVDVVQNNIKKRGNEWDKNSPVWNNSQYLNDIYTEFKQNFLRDVQRWSRTLVYDWSDGGDAEVVIEDIEHTELDMIEMYDDQQKDWRFNDEQGAAFQRNRYTNLNRIHEKLATLDVLEMEFNDILRANCEDTIAMEDVIRWLPSHAYEFGYNAHLGDNMATTLLWGDKSNLRKLQRQFKYNWFFPVAEKSLLERASLLKGETSLTQLKKSN